jgi:hypothetical protein
MQYTAIYYVWLWTGFGLIIGFNGLLHFVTTSNSNSSWIYWLYNSLCHAAADVPLPVGSLIVPVYQPQQFSANQLSTTAFSRRLTLARLSLSTPLSKAVFTTKKCPKLCYDRRSVGQFGRPMARVYLCVCACVRARARVLMRNNFLLLHVGLPLWLEDVCSMQCNHSLVLVAQDP